MQIDVLGPLRVRRDGVEIDLGTPRQRAIVAALALEQGQVLSVPGLIARVWGDRPPATVTGTLQSYVGQLRRALEPDRGPRQPATVLVTEHGGYALRVPRTERDDTALAAAVGTARGLLAVVPDPLRPAVPAASGAADRVAEALATVETALASWRGTPYADLGDDPDVEAERARLEDHRTAARELQVVAQLALGRHDEVAPALEAMTRSHPLHERWWTLWAVALARSGRQADALAALQRLRSVLDDELGVEPSGPVRELQTAILRQDPTVTWHDRSAPPAAPAVDVRLDGPAPASAATPAPPRPAWPLAGRTDELARLVAALDAAAAGRAVAAWVAGEAGIGKTRLAAEAARVAYERGFAVATVDCGQPGAPALWPWRQALRALGTALPDGDPDDVETWAAGAEAVRAAARARPVLLVLEDVHDADPASLSLLRHLVASGPAATAGERLLVLSTRRAGAGDDAALGAIAAGIARQDGVRVDLSGLAPDDARQLVGSATGEEWALTRVAALTERSGGNPFFLVELARAGGAVSGSLTDVVAARLAELPTATRTALAVAAVVGREHDPALVALALGTDRAALAADRAPALAAGMVVEPDPGAQRLAFAHAVVRDVVLDALTSTERSHWHARVAAELDAHSGLRRVEHRADLARHWELAGPEHAGVAWRAILRAAEQAGLDPDHREAADLLARAVVLQEQDPAGHDRERYELLMLLIDAQRWAGQWGPLARSVDLAMAAAERIGDHALAARAAMATIEGAVWQVRTFGVVHAPVVAALERSLARLDADDAAVGLRARGRIALATELYYSTEQERVDALVAEAVALAEGSGDLRLQSVVLAGAFSARWRTDTLSWRSAVAERVLAIATELGDARAQALAQALVVCAALERGDLDVVRAQLPVALGLARHLGLVTAEVVLLAADIPLRAMAGDDETAARELAEAAELARHSRVPNFDRALSGTAALAALWAGDVETLAALGERFEATDGEGVSMRHVGPWLLLRLGLADLARDTFRASDVDLDDPSYTLLANACLACELGLGLDLPDLAARGYAIARPHAGLMTSGGSAMALGPVDGFLALGALSAGDRAAATRHADDAEALGRAWGLDRYVAWVAGVRAVYGF